MLQSFTDYELLIFLSLNYTELNVLENPNGSIDFYQILYHTFSNVIRCMYEDLARFIDYFKNRDGK